MSKKAARNFFIFGSLFFIVLVILTIDTMIEVPKRAPVITAEVDAGKKVWHRYDCIGYHTILENGFHLTLDKTNVASRKPEVDAFSSLL